MVWQRSGGAAGESSPCVPVYLGMCHLPTHIPRCAALPCSLVSLYIPRWATYLIPLCSHAYPAMCHPSPCVPVCLEMCHLPTHIPRCATNPVPVHLRTATYLVPVCPCISRDVSSAHVFLRCVTRSLVSRYIPRWATDLIPLCSHVYPTMCH